MNSHPTDRIVHEVVLTVTDRAGALLSLVTFIDGGYGFSRDGKPLDGYFWPERHDGQMKQCVEALAQLAGLDDDN